MTGESDVTYMDLPEVAGDVTASDEPGGSVPLASGDAEWDEASSGLRLRPRTAALAALALVTGSVAAYDYAVVPPETPLVAGYDPSGIDWLFGLSLGVFALYVLVPAVRRPDRTRAVLADVRRSRAATASLAYLAAFFLVGLFGPFVLGPPSPGLLAAEQPPVFGSVSNLIVGNCLGEVAAGRCHGTMRYPFGTDPFGKDMLLVTVQGARVALVVALVSSTIIVPIAAAVGVTAGYFGGRADALLMRYVDIQQTVPAVVVYFIAIFLYGRSLFLIVLVFGLLGWGGVARIVRSEVVSLRTERYVTAAKSAGASDLDVIRRHVLPNVAGTVVVSTAQQIPYLIVVEASLSFMKLNAIELPSWGETIRWGMGDYFPLMWWISTWPLLCLVVTATAFGVFGDALRDALDPQT
ncbi:ABC transporter permease [Halopelagius longus]|uniref:ABC transporter permease n=1 Tax=Halopelagius longus TaxID=1236180 RepID=A0A370IN51_9EURY|nr:ABC transporter permease [Halopelagius longus]